MVTQEDLFAEEEQMVAMSFGDHLEELRVRLLLAIIGLFVGMIITLLPPLNLGMAIMRAMQEPAQSALQRHFARSAAERAQNADEMAARLEPMTAIIPADQLISQLRLIAPSLNLPDPSTLQGRSLEVALAYPESAFIKAVARTVEPRNALISLSPLETVTIFLMVCLVAGLVLASPWVFHQIWAFVAAGLYRHEKAYVKKFLPFSLGLFLAGVFLCFFVVLPLTLRVLLEFNVWLGVEPSLRLSDWMGFATLLPLVFGICFQTPLVMLFLARIGVFTAEQYRSKRKFAILIMVVVAALLTPDPTVTSQLLLAAPMICLYEVGIMLVERGQNPGRLASGGSSIGG
ncbi:Sec-independent protein translocase, TatC subunit [Isosphaera pallida ATCC 43644]|uniref:Sec-independent protein translocase protein TatC n=1 Tax=Isosphaera pallida (strain ATCC 43644 / DSM 9630 / IS1B) TaxID=575540 RepID=E8R5A8_ISOPI|nr:twin-arginine translocase subunit TatC [Isosphaera pallida]ADV63861.1 Sec-independent protein translocase, TatC subunit [Isosphaera pallida ATCC 43644]